MRDWCLVADLQILASLPVSFDIALDNCPRAAAAASSTALCGAPAGGLLR